MKAIVITPGTTDIRIKECAEPGMSGEYDIKMKVLQVGICGTDREEATGGRSLASNGSKELIIGHEMIGKIVETGKHVTRARAGDLAVFTVRRGCNVCLPCRMNRSDMCTSGNFTERGIWGRDGYQAEFVVDEEQYAVAIPATLGESGVLAEPMSIVEKAIEEAVRLQTLRLPDAASRPNWLYGRRCLVAGLGPVGLLGALALRLRGAEVYGLDIVDKTSPRAEWLSAIGGQYIDGRTVQAKNVEKSIGPMEFILEAAGIPQLDFELLDVLASNGIHALTGIPGGDRPIQISGAQVMRRLVLKNQLMVGSVNAARDHFQMAVDDLQSAVTRWGALPQQLITHHYSYLDYRKALTEHPADEIKSVVVWSKGGV